MAKLEKRLDKMRRAPANVPLDDVAWVCQQMFGSPRQRSTSHVVFSMPWSGDPRVILQEKNGKAKEYQVKQALAAIDRLTGEDDV